MPITKTDFIGKIKSVNYPEPVPDEPTVSGTLPLSFECDGSQIKKLSFLNETTSNIGIKSVNILPDLDKWLMHTTLTSPYGGLNDSAPTFVTSDFIPIEASTTYKMGHAGYTYGVSNPDFNRIAFYDSNKVCLESYTRDSNTYTNIVTPENAAYLRVCIIDNRYKPYMVKSAEPSIYIPYGYRIPILFNNITYPVCIDDPSWDRLVLKDVINISDITFTDGSLKNSSGSGSPAYFKVLPPSNNSYKAYGRLTAAADKYVFGQWGDTTERLAEGMYTMCLTVHNPPTTDSWEIRFYVGSRTSSSSLALRGCKVTSEDVVNGVATASEVIIVDEMIQNRVSYGFIQFVPLGTDPEYFPNVVVDVRIIEGSVPSFVERYAQSGNQIKPIADMQKMMSNDGTNTLDVDTSPKPTKAIITLNTSSSNSESSNFDDYFA